MKFCVLCRFSVFSVVLRFPEWDGSLGTLVCAQDFVDGCADVTRKTHWDTYWHWAISVGRAPHWPNHFFPSVVSSQTRAVSWFSRAHCKSNEKIALNAIQNWTTTERFTSDNKSQKMMLVLWNYSDLILSWSSSTFPCVACLCASSRCTFSSLLLFFRCSMCSSFSTTTLWSFCFVNSSSWTCSWKMKFFLLACWTTERRKSFKTFWQWCPFHLLHLGGVLKVGYSLVEVADLDKHGVHHPLKCGVVAERPTAWCWLHWQQVELHRGLANAARWKLSIVSSVWRNAVVPKLSWCEYLGSCFPSKGIQSPRVPNSYQEGIRNSADGSSTLLHLSTGFVCLHFLSLNFAWTVDIQNKVAYLVPGCSSWAHRQCCQCRLRKHRPSPRKTPVSAPSLHLRREPSPLLNHRKWIVFSARVAHPQAWFSCQWWRL